MVHNETLFQIAKVDKFNFENILEMVFDNFRKTNFVKYEDDQISRQRMDDRIVDINKYDFYEKTENSRLDEFLEDLIAYEIVLGKSDRVNTLGGIFHFLAPIKTYLLISKSFMIIGYSFKRLNFIEPELREYLFYFQQNYNEFVFNNIFSNTSNLGKIRSYKMKTNRGLVEKSDTFLVNNNFDFNISSIKVEIYIQFS